ncbi:MAG TPA: alpha/beta fold hydrolase [Acidimicrobiales bacterium]|nr:alpha/beta fold hydrolase [Acidimicrobiales bacterium]
MGPLHAEVVGTGPPLVLLHGFTQTGRSFGPFGTALGRSHQLILVDLPGHGGSAPVHGDLPTCGEAVLETAAALARPPFPVLGYSLGARVALHAALDRSEQVARLVLIGATAGIVDAERRAARRAADERLADELEADADVEAFVTRWLAGPLFAGLPAAAAGRAERLVNTPAGLAASLREAGTGTQEPLDERLTSLHVPTLLVAGAADPRFVDAALRLARSLPEAVVSVVPGATHAAHLHQPLTTAAIVGRWLAAAG